MVGKALAHSGPATDKCYVPTDQGKLEHQFDALKGMKASTVLDSFLRNHRERIFKESSKSKFVLKKFAKTHPEEAELLNDSAKVDHIIQKYKFNLSLQKSPLKAKS